MYLIKASCVLLEQCVAFVATISICHSGLSPVHMMPFSSLLSPLYPQSCSARACPGSGLPQLRTTEKPQLFGDSQIPFPKARFCVHTWQTDRRREVASPRNHSNTGLKRRELPSGSFVSLFEKMGLVRFTSHGCYEDH